MAPLPELNSDVLSWIFFRLPPDEPEHLFHVSLVCKPWLGIVTDPDFLRCYRALYQTPPLLGYLQMRRYSQRDPEARLIPTTSVSLDSIPFFGRHDYEALDCRHGRVLLRDVGHLVIWDPITGDRKHVLEVRDAMCCAVNYNAVVCCAVNGCDHLQCHGGPFQVVFIVSDARNQVKVCVYSSKTGSWSTLVNRINDCDIQPWRGAIIGDEIYFGVSGETDAIIKYHMHENCLSMINPPIQDEDLEFEDNIALMEMENNSLGFVCIQGSNLHIWSRMVNSEGVVEWVQCKVVELGKRMPIATSDDEAFVVGAAEGVGVIFVSIDAGLFTVKVSSGQVKKIGEPGYYCSILPFMSFYTPDCGKIIGC